MSILHISIIPGPFSGAPGNSVKDSVKTVVKSETNLSNSIQYWFSIISIFHYWDYLTKLSTSFMSKHRKQECVTKTFPTPAILFLLLLLYFVTFLNIQMLQEVLPAGAHHHPLKLEQRSNLYVGTWWRDTFILLCLEAEGVWTILFKM